MLTNKEIRELPIPKVTKAVREIALQEPSKAYGINSKPMCLTHSKVGTVDVINFFYKDSDGKVVLGYRFFVEGQEVRTQDFYQKDKICIKKAHVKNLIDYREGFYRLIGLNSKTEARIRAAIGKSIGHKEDKTVTMSVLFDRHSWTLREMHTINNRKKRQEQRDALMKYAKPLPSSFSQTISKSCDSIQRAFYNKRKGTYVCSGCLSVNTLPPNAIRNDKVVCPTCNRTLTCIPEGLYMNQKENAMAVYIQAMGTGRLLVRYFTIKVSFAEDFKQQYDYSEDIRTIIDYNKHTVADFEYWWSGNHDDTRAWVPPRPSFWRPDGLHYEFFKGLVYTDTLMDEFKEAGVEKMLSNYSEVCMKIKQNIQANSVYGEIRYLEYLSKYPQLERLTKCKLWNLAYYYYRDDIYSRNDQGDSGIINYEESSLKKALGVNNNVFKQIVACDPTHKQLLTVLKAYKDDRKQPRSVFEIITVEKFFGHYKDEVLKMPKALERKIKTYIESSDIVVGDYFDYIEAAKKLNYDMTSEMVLYPKRFEQAHDEATESVKDKAHEAEYEAVRKLLPALHQIFDYKDEKRGLMIVAPNDAKDIIREGQVLHHCVGGYVGKVAKGTTVILFVRSLAEPNKPLVTVEISPKTHGIIQQRGHHNSTPSTEVQEFLDEYKKKIAIA